MTKLTLLFLLTFATSVHAQSNFVTRDSAHIFWQPGTTLSLSDFKGDSTSKYKVAYFHSDMKAMAYIGIWSILDVPKKKKDRGKKQEKVYIAPAFDIKASYALTSDNTQIAKQQIYFDIAEVWARWARQQFKSYQDTIPGYGIVFSMYSTVIRDMKAQQAKMNDEYTKEIFVDKSPDAFAKWRKMIDDKLEETKAWATTPQDCFRFISDKPVDEDYEQSPTVMGAIPQ
ncbi:hypothetical protein [Pinibacter aurantiacus]|uniref:Uncharacterized protein n=1 Tax=Pinibacter aurantiacus TaxID=2851599 RepID=A0A9E2W6U3_9BACT|nr:hypothetical protein [Pinibacter aurantiacus]MBV4360243.1 hypothetical protein [Pinibacter aurantiacus]